MNTLKGKVIFITGASRGIGLAIALKAAKDGAKICIAAKSTEAQEKLEGTIYSAAEAVRVAGGEALAVPCDIRSEEQVKAAVEACVKEFGGIDILVNNASAIQLTPTLQTDMKRFDLMHQVNTRGTFLCSKTCLPQLLKAENPHVLNLSPPLNMEERWFAPHVAYTMAKFGMSQCVLGMAGEFRGKVAFNALWPRTAIATSAVKNLLGGEEIMKHSRKPSIMADAAVAIFNRDAKTVTGNFYIDDEVMAEEGVTDLDQYSMVEGAELVPDFFV